MRSYFAESKFGRLKREGEILFLHLRGAAMRRFASDEAIETSGADLAVAARREPTKGWCKSILAKAFLCVLAFSFMSAAWPQRAAAQFQEGYLGWVSPAGPTGYFASAREACYAQWDRFMSGGQSRFIGAIPTENANLQNCSWTLYQWLCHEETGGGISGCGTLWPNYVELNCASGYTPAFGAYCIKDPIPERETCTEATANPTVGNPIVLATGSKIVTATDFATSDGKFVISRSYRSLPGASVGAKFFPRNLGGNWNFDFGYELQLGVFSGSPSTPNAKLTVTAPDGSAYDFALQSNGSWAPDTTTGAFFAPTNLKLEFIGTLPGNLADIRTSPSQWRLTDGNDTVWTFQTFTRPQVSASYIVGRPTSRVTREGYEWTFAYRADTSLETITDSFGRQATFNWSMFHVSIMPWLPGGEPFPEAVASVELPDGSTLRYSYDPPPAASAPSVSAIERLVKVERLDASSTVINSTAYAYADSRHPRHITSITDFRNVQVATYAYDARGRAISTAGGGGADSYTVEYGETATEHTRRVVNPLGKAAVFRFEKLGSANQHRLASVDGEASTNCPSSVRSLTYGTDNFIASRVDEEGRTTAYTRDSRGRPLTITEASGDPLARTTTFTWHSTLNVPTVIARPGLTESRTYSSGQLTNVTLTDTTTITVPYATNGRTRSWAYDWTPAGLLEFVDGPLSGSADTVFFAYDADGYLATRIDEVGRMTRVVSRDGRGAPLTLEDENGVQTVITYDGVGRPLTVTGNPGPQQSQYAMEYDDAGNLTKVTMTEGGWLAYQYDDASRVTRIDNDRGEYQTFTLNDVGAPTAETVKNAGGTITRQRSIVYDELGRVIEAVGAGSQTWEFEYDKVSNLVETTDGRSKQWATGWDALDRVVTETDPTSAQHRYDYAENDALTEFQDGRNVTTTRIVDGFGHTIYEDSPDRGARTFWYDAAGRLIKILEPDAPPNGTPDEHISYTYDSTASGNFGSGRLTSISDPSGSASLAYDAHGRLIAEQKTIQGQSYQVAYGYDDNGALTSITYPSGHVVTYERAIDGKITAVRHQVTSGGGTTDLATNVAYAPFGPLTGLTYGNGLALTRTHDQNYWLTGIELVGSGSPLLDLTFGRDANGNVTGVTDNAASGRAAVFTYTDNDRLASANGMWGDDVYTWDDSGNRTRVDRTISGNTVSDVATIASGTNRLTEIRDGGGVLSKAFTLRTGGDLEQQTVSGGPTLDYVYSPRKRLASVKSGGVEVGSYLYDHAGRRVARTLPATSQTIHYVYGPGGMLLAEHDGATGAMLKEYVWLDDMPLAQVSGPVVTPSFAFVHTGQIGEPLMVTDASQAKLWDVAVDPWGNALLLSTPTTEQDLRYPGQRRQAESGLFQNWMRDYDPTLGRYIETDPIGLAGGPNVYTYALGNPLKYTDPTGEAVPWVAAAGTALLIYYLWDKYSGEECIDDISREKLGWLPIVGDYIGFEDFWNAPSLATGVGAFAGLVPVAGDAVRKGLKGGFPGGAGRGGHGGGPGGAGPGGGAPQPTDFVGPVRVTDIRTGNVYEGTVDLRPTLDRIGAGGTYPHRNDATHYRNDNGALPAQPPGYYTEYVHPTPGISGAGPQRIVTGKGGEIYYTPDHYDTFIPITP